MRSLASTLHQGACLSTLSERLVGCCSQALDSAQQRMAAAGALVGGAGVPGAHSAASWRWRIGLPPRLPRGCGPGRRHGPGSVSPRRPFHEGRCRGRSGGVRQPRRCGVWGGPLDPARRAGEHAAMLLARRPGLRAHAFRGHWSSALRGGRPSQRRLLVRHRRLATRHRFRQRIRGTAPQRVPGSGGEVRRKTEGPGLDAALVRRRAPGLRSEDVKRSIFWPRCARRARASARIRARRAGR